MRPDGPAYDRRQSGVALEPGRRGVLEGSHPDPGGEGLDGELLLVDLAERREYVADVAQERVVRPDDEYALPGELIAVGIEQVSGAMQSDGGLAGAGRTLDADRGVEIGADDDVLVGLDGRDDVPHRPDPRPLDLGFEDGAVELRLDRFEMLVLVRRELPVLEPESAPQPDAHRLARAGPIERAGDLGPPVDHHRFALGVGDVAPTDVETFGGSRRR